MLGGFPAKFIFRLWSHFIQALEIKPSFYLAWRWLLIIFIWQFLFCSDNSKWYITHQIRPTFYKILKKNDLSFRFLFGFPAAFRSRNINLRVEIFNRVPSMLNFVQFLTISWPFQFHFFFECLTSLLIFHVFSLNFRLPHIRSYRKTNQNQIEIYKR